MKKRRRRIPLFIRPQLSCPDCGYVFSGSPDDSIWSQDYFNCPKCGVRHEYYSFIHDNMFKLDYRHADFSFFN